MFLLFLFQLTFIIFENTSQNHFTSLFFSQVDILASLLNLYLCLHIEVVLTTDGIFNGLRVESTEKKSSMAYHIGHTQHKEVNIYVRVVIIRRT